MENPYATAYRNDIARSDASDCCRQTARLTSGRRSVCSARVVAHGEVGRCSPGTEDNTSPRCRIAGPLIRLISASSLVDLAFSCACRKVGGICVREVCASQSSRGPRDLDTLPQRTVNLECDLKHRLARGQTMLPISNGRWKTQIGIYCVTGIALVPH